MQLLLPFFKTDKIVKITFFSSGRREREKERKLGGKTYYGRIVEVMHAGLAASRDLQQDKARV